MKNPKEETENHMNGEHPNQGVPSFNQLSDASIDGIMVFDSELKVCYFNKNIYEIIGNSDKPIILGMGFRELRNISKLFEHIGNIMFKVKQENKPVIPFSIIFGCHNIVIRAFPIEDSPFGKRCYQLVIFNADELVQKQRILNEAERINSISILTNGLAHEINNPLAGVSNVLQLLKSGKISPEKQTAIIEKAEDNIKRISDIIDKLRLFSRFSRTNSANFNLNEAIETVIPSVLAQTQDSGVSLNTEYSERPIKINGYQSGFGLAMTNFLLNAYEATPQGGSIVIKTGIENILGKDTAVIRIIDTGCGMTDEELQQCFDPFYTSKKVWQGTGLGMAVSYRIIQTLRGTVKITSQKGSGTTVEIHIPIAI